MVRLWTNGRLVWRSITLAIVLVGCHVSGAIAESIDHASESQTNSTNTTSQANTSPEISEELASAWELSAYFILALRYSCIMNDGCQVWQRTMTRSELGEAFYDLQEKINELISSGQGYKFSTQELVMMRRLQEEYASELASMRGRVDALPADVVREEVPQFSTTTKVVDRVTLALRGVPDTDRYVSRSPMSSSYGNDGEADGEFVNPGDWARVELARLSHEYGCVPFDPKLRPQAVPRDQFVAKLSPCLDRIYSLPIAVRTQPNTSWDIVALESSNQSHSDEEARYIVKLRDRFNKNFLIFKSVKSSDLIYVLEEDRDIAARLHIRFGTDIFVFKSIKPDDWQYKALVRMIEKYECIEGYEGDLQKSLSRREFAAGLNACLDNVYEMISNGLAEKFSREDLSALQQLKEEFAADIAALSGLQALIPPPKANFYSDDENLADGEMLDYPDRYFGNTIRPNDPLYQSLVEIGEHYECEGFKRPDNDRSKLQPLTRYEFSIGASDCIQEIFEKVELESLPREHIVAIMNLGSGFSLKPYIIYNDSKLAKNTIESSSQILAPDWVYPVFTRLKERYHCFYQSQKIEQAVNRIQVSQLLYVCLDRFNEIISAGLLDKIQTEDLVAIIKLRREFNQELIALIIARSRHDFE
jgi:hypothetical protein